MLPFRSAAVVGVVGLGTVCASICVFLCVRACVLQWEKSKEKVKEIKGEGEKGTGSACSFEIPTKSTSSGAGIRQLLPRGRSGPDESAHFISVSA